MSAEEKKKLGGREKKWLRRCCAEKQWLVKCNFSLSPLHQGVAASCLKFVKTMG